MMPLSMIEIFSQLYFDKNLITTMARFFSPPQVFVCNNLCTLVDVKRIKVFKTIDTVRDLIKFIFFRKVLSS